MKLPRLNAGDRYDSLAHFLLRSTYKISHCQEEFAYKTSLQTKHCTIISHGSNYFKFQGGKEAELGGTVWIPLQKDDESSDLPDFTIDNVTELPEVLPNSPKLRRSK